MPATIPFTEEAIEEMIVSSVKHVCSTMLSVDLEFEKSCNPDPETGQSNLPIKPDEPLVAGSVGFIGNVNGIVYIYLPEKLSLLVTSNMLGMTEEEMSAEGPDTVNDALGEISNMTVGTFKNKLCDQGFNCRLTIPSILRGNHFAIQTAPSIQVFRKSFIFKAFGLPLVVDLLMKPSTNQT